MSRNNGSSGIVKFAAWLLVIVLLAGIGLTIYFGVKSEGFKEWDFLNGGQTEEPTEEEQPSGVTDGDGNELESGTMYALPTAMVYAAPTAESASAGEGVTVTATVKPETAIDKSVTWSVAFANAESVWASGKTASDYLTVTPDEEDSRIAVLTCKEAFGEQILLTCASVSDPDKTATCTVDYAQTVTGVTVKIGNVELVMGGDTEVTVDIGHDNTDRGGEITMEYTLSEVYTIAESGVTNAVALTHECLDASGDYFAYQGVAAGTPGGTSYRLDYDDISEGLGKSVYFDTRLFADYNFAYGTSSFYDTDKTPFSEMDITTIKNYCDSRIGKTLWTLTATATGTYTSFTAESDIVLSEIDGWAEVEGINVDPSQIVFS